MWRVNGMQDLRIVFFGTPRFALPSLQALIKRGQNPIAVVTQPDRRVGRGQHEQVSPIKDAALRVGLSILQPEKVRAPDFLEQFRALEPDVAVVAAYGQIFSRNLLDIPRFGFINVHSSLLPSYRGAAPINWAIINGEQESGVTIMQVDLEMDSGPIVLQHKELIEPEDTAAMLHDRLAVLGGKLLGQTLDQLAGPGWQPVPQQHDLATYAPMLSKSDGLIDWSQPAAAIYNRLRGMTPWPGCHTLLDGRILKIHGAGVRDAFIGSVLPGTVVQAEGQGITVATGGGALVIFELQLEGKKRMSAADFLKGTGVQSGTVLGKESGGS
jgi:methionyl-tRNA formyltransferase